MRVLGMRVSGPFSKLLEVAGAGLASAIGAFLLSQMISKPAPTAPAPQLVQIAPADAKMLGIMHSDQAALLAELQKGVPQAAHAPASPPAPKAAQGERPKPVKTAQSVPIPLPRQPKVEARPVAANYKATPEEPLPIQPISAAAPATVAAEPEARATDEGSTGGRFRVFSALKQIPSWFVPDNAKVVGNAPRPPAPVGQVVSSAM